MGFAARMASVVALAACLGFVGCQALVPPMPLEQLNVQQAHGHEVFRAQCAACHYDRKNRPLHGPSMLNVYKRKELPSGAPANDERVAEAIVRGRGMMPAQGNKVSGQDLDDLLAYLHTL